MTSQTVTIVYVSANNGDGNITLSSTSSITPGKRYKRETTLKFTEGSVDSYVSFKSRFNIHRKILGWDDHRTGIELYMSLESKSAF